VQTLFFSKMIFWKILSESPTKSK